MTGRPLKEDSRDKQYRVRLNNEEDDMLNYCSEETGKAKSEIFRKALKAYYENTKYVKNLIKDKEKQSEQETGIPDFDKYEEQTEVDFDDNGMDGISLKRAIECPYCGSENNMDFADNYETSNEERKMGPQIEYMFDWEDCTCDECGKKFRVHGSIWEYPMGAYNYEEIEVEKLEDEEE